MGFFLNNIYSIWKLHFWRFPEMLCHQQKVVNHQSGQAKMKISDFGLFPNMFFRNFHFLSWNDIFAIGNWILILSSIWKLHFWGFPEIQKRNWRFDIFISWKKWFFRFCLTTLMVHNFFLVTEHLWKTSEMEFSERVLS